MARRAPTLADRAAAGGCSTAANNAARQLETTPRARSATPANRRAAQPRLAPHRTWATKTAAPQANPSDPWFLRGEFAGTTFPDYPGRLGARAWGQRTDLIGGRTVRTVYYRLGDGRPISYSVVSGAPLATPPSDHRVIVTGVRVRSYGEHRLNLVTSFIMGTTACSQADSRRPSSEALAAAPLLEPDQV